MNLKTQQKLSKRIYTEHQSAVGQYQAPYIYVYMLYIHIMCLYVYVCVYWGWSR